MKQSLKLSLRYLIKSWHSVRQSKFLRILKMQPKEQCYGYGQEPKKHNTPENVFKGKSCYNCNRHNHQVDECCYKDAECNFCRKKEHIETACLLMKRKRKIGSITSKNTRVAKSLHIPDSQPIYKSIYLNGRNYKFQVDTGS